MMLLRTENAIQMKSGMGKVVGLVILTYWLGSSSVRITFHRDKRTPPLPFSAKNIYPPRSRHPERFIALVYNLLIRRKNTNLKRKTHRLQQNPDTLLLQLHHRSQPLRPRLIPGPFPPHLILDADLTSPPPPALSQYLHIIKISTPPLLCHNATGTPQFPQLCCTSLKFLIRYGTHGASRKKQNTRAHIL